MPDVLKPPVQPPPKAEKEPRLMRIAKRAHELYRVRGGEHGRDLEDWLRAEREIDGESDE